MDSGGGVTPEERIARREEIRVELGRKLREIIDEAERLSTLDPIWVFNDVHKLHSLIGQVNDLTYKYRRLT